jgi:hypothetical protein
MESVPASRPDRYRTAGNCMHSGVMTPPGARTIGPAATFSSSLTFPGQSWASILSSASWRIEIGRSERPRKRCTRRVRLSLRSRNGGGDRDHVRVIVKILSCATPATARPHDAKAVLSPQFGLDLLAAFRHRIDRFHDASVKAVNLMLARSDRWCSLLRATAYEPKRSGLTFDACLHNICSWQILTLERWIAS